MDTVRIKLTPKTDSKKDEEGITYTFSGGGDVYPSSKYINLNRIEIAFVIDVTGSMRSYIDGVRSCLKELVVDFKEKLSHYSLEFGICFYRDKKNDGIICKKKKSV